jgi:hypothetical protein
VIRYVVLQISGEPGELWSDSYPCWVNSLNFGSGFDPQGSTTPRQLADSVDLDSLVDILRDSRAAEIDREKAMEAIPIAIGRRSREKVRVGRTASQPHQRATAVSGPPRPGWKASHMIRYILPAALLAAFLQAQEHHPLPPPKPPQAICYYYSHDQDWWVKEHAHENPLLIRVNGKLKSYTEATTVSMDQPCGKRPADPLADHFHDFRLVGNSRKDKIERVILPPPEQTINQYLNRLPAITIQPEAKEPKAAHP